MSNNHDDIAARLRDEASATAPERLRADVMLRVRAEARPQRIRPRRSFGRSFATVAAAACILGALVLGLSRVDFGGTSSSSGGGSMAAETRTAPMTAGAGAKSTLLAPRQSATPHQAIVPYGPQANGNASKAITPSAVPRPLRAAILGRVRLAAPLRDTFGALDPHARPIPH